MTALDGIGVDLKHHQLCAGVEIKKRSLLLTSGVSPQAPPQQSQQNRRKTPQPTLNEKSAFISCKKTTLTTKPAIYTILLELILLTLRLVQFVRLYAYRIYYSLAESAETLGVCEWLSLPPSSKSIVSTAPTHVCVVLNEEVEWKTCTNELVEKLSLIVDLMSAHGTRLVSFYAHNQLNVELVEKIKRKYTGSNRDSNNNDDCKRVEVRFVTSSSGAGKSLLVDTCRLLARQVQSSQLEAKNISQKLVDTTIQELSKMPEPELVVAIGEQDTLAGLSPWHIRLSEIIKIQSYKLINKRTINELLKRYEKIEKRFGK